MKKLLLFLNLFCLSFLTYSQVPAYYVDLPVSLSTVDYSPFETGSPEDAMKIVTGVYDVYAYPRLTNITIFDGGGLVTSKQVILQSNATYQNYSFTGSGGFSATSAVSNVLIQNCQFLKMKGMAISINPYADKPPTSTNIEIRNCYSNDFSMASQYYFDLSGVTGYKVHDCAFLNGGMAQLDCGIIYPRFSSGDCYNLFFDQCFGKCVRAWPLTGSTSNFYNIIYINGKGYSAFELNGGYSNGWTVNMYNITAGNIPAAAYNGAPAGLVTTYDLGGSYTVKNCVVFNTSVASTGGIIDNFSGTAGIPSNWNGTIKPQQGCTYAAKSPYSSDSTTLLPDGSKWNGSTVIPPPPPVNKAPIANAGSNQTVTLPNNMVNLDGSASIDPDGSIAVYSWKQISGPSTATITNGAASRAIVSLLQQGVYIFQLTVTDNQGATNTSMATITISPAACPPPVICPACPVIPAARKVKQIIYDDGFIQNF